MVGEQKSNWTPWIIILVLVVVLVAVFNIRKFSPQNTSRESPRQVTVENEFSQPLSPSSITLTIDTPQNGETVNSSKVNIKGKTSANAEVYVNEMDSKADASGNFSVTYTLEEGENYLIVGANDDEGNMTEQELMLYYQG